MNMIGIIRKIITIIAVNCLVLIVLLALLELTGFIMVGRPYHGFHSSWRLNHIFEPMGTVVHSEHIPLNPDFPEPYTRTFNKQGWPETYDVNRRKTPGTYRIFYVGDSFIAGSCSADQTLPSNIKKLLNQEKKDKNLHIEVVNTGTNSYSPIIYYVLIRYVICDYQPDLIVVAVDMTDDYDDWKYKHTAIFDKDGNPLAVPPRDCLLSPFIDAGQGAVKATPIGRFQCFLYQNSSFYNMIRNIVRSNIKEPPNSLYLGNAGSEVAIVKESNKPFLYKQWQWCKEPWDSLTAAQVQTTLDYIRRICKFCHEKNIKLMLTSVPHYEQYNGDAQGRGKPGSSARPHKEIAGVAAQCGVPYHNVFEDLKPLITGTPHTQYYCSGDMHFNPRGYRIWADAQYKFLSDSSNHLLPGSFY